MEVLQGLRSGRAVVRLIDQGTHVASSFVLNTEKTVQDDAKIPTLTSALIVDIPIDDSGTIEVKGGEQPDSNNQSWDDLVYSITQRIFESYRTEKSWKLGAVATGSTTRAHDKISIDDCFQLFSSEEVLGEEDQWYCGNCKLHVRASKKIDLWKLPQILIIHLKRFQYSRGYRNKIESIVDFPIDDVLDMSKFVPPVARLSSDRYRLFGISNHMGSLYSGHYTAYAKLWEDVTSPTHRRRDEWYSFNDSYVQPLGDSPVCDSSNYLLFYQRLPT
jgi:hypothetical protein